MPDSSNVLMEDMEFIADALRDFSCYSLEEDISLHMEALGLTKNALAARAQVSHTMVGRWLDGAARPHGKERFKELGMALGMDEERLNRFLLQNGYPRLYVKNPLDAACNFVLSESAGQPQIVTIYREFLRHFGLDAYTLEAGPAHIATAVLSRDFSNVQSTKSFGDWLEENKRYFRAHDKAYIASPQLACFIMLYLGDKSINERFITGELTIALRALLYSLLGEQEVAVRRLRDKLIVFGLQENMTEDEIDIMLNLGRLRPMSEPAARVDFVILLALRCAHERYPYFELQNAEKALKNPKIADMPELHGFYREQRRRSGELVEYYEKNGDKSDNLVFVELFTDYNASGIMHYIRALLHLLIQNGVLAEDEIEPYLTLMRTYFDTLPPQE